MTAKEKRFCEEYVKDLNAKQAAIRAGYSLKSAKEIGYENLTKPHLEKYIQDLKSKIKERNDVDVDALIDEQKEIAFANVQNFLDPDNQIKDILTIDKKTARSIQSVKSTTITNLESSTSKVVTEIKLYSKLDAIEKLNKHLGLYEKHNSQRQTQVENLTFAINKRKNKEDAG